MRWFEKAYRRNVIDMHITDYDESFMTQFSAERYVEMLELSKAQSAVVYAQSHVGLCYYRTQVGEMHKGLRGKDIFGELVDLCHKKGINVVAYYSLIYNNWAYYRNPDWRIVFADGSLPTDKVRYGVCCPNSSGYREFVLKQIEELCNNYDFEGIRFDMTFWPGVCYCPSCRERYKNEVGGEMPVIVDWKDQRWVGFQRKREQWLIEFAKLCTDAVRKIKPGISVEHQSSTYPLSWSYGVTWDLSEQNDFLQGDFYGDWLQGSFVCKLLYNLTPNRPFGFETSSNRELSDHTTLKSRELLKAKAYASLANGGAFIFIDAIDPVGTLNEKVYKTMGEIYKETADYEKYLGGELVQDVAVYLSTESKFDFKDNGLKVTDIECDAFVTEPKMDLPHISGVLSVTEALIHNNIPFGVITKKKLKDLQKYKVLILSNVLMMDEEETEEIKKFVNDGGCVYASKYTSLISKDGKLHDNFMLADIFGVNYSGETKEKYTYIKAADDSSDILEGYSSKYPLSVYGTQMIVKANLGVKVLGEIVLPYTDPADIKNFSSIHSNPPGITTDYPSIVLNCHGKGKAIYSAAHLENFKHCQDVFIGLIHMLCKSFHFESNAPKPVEITMFEQQDKKRLIVNLLNFQKELPNIPIEGIKLKIKLDGKTVKKLVLMPEEKELKYELSEDHIVFEVSRLDTFLMLGLYYK